MIVGGVLKVFVSNKIFPQAQEILDQYDCETYLVPMRKYNVYENEAEDRADVLFKKLKILCDKPFPCKD